MEKLKTTSSITKAQLANMYNPGVNTNSALKTLNRWIARDSKLLAELQAARYYDKQRVLTPKQVEIIIKYLGEP